MSSREWSSLSVSDLTADRDFGIGVSVEGSTVRSLLPGTQVQRHGEVAVGDIIAAVDGDAAANWGVRGVGLALELIKRLSGRRNSPVTLTIFRPSASEGRNLKNVTLVRDTPGGAQIHSNSNPREVDGRSPSSRSGSHASPLSSLLRGGYDSRSQNGHGSGSHSHREKERERELLSRSTSQMRDPSPYRSRGRSPSPFSGGRRDEASFADVKYSSTGGMSRSSSSAERLKEKAGSLNSEFGVGALAELSQSQSRPGTASRGMLPGSSRGVSPSRGGGGRGREYNALSSPRHHQRHALEASSNGRRGSPSRVGTANSLWESGGGEGWRSIYDSVASNPRDAKWDSWVLGESASVRRGGGDGGGGDDGLSLVAAKEVIVSTSREAFLQGYKAAEDKLSQQVMDAEGEAARVLQLLRGHKKIGQLEEADVLDYMRLSTFCMEQTDCASIFRAIYYEVYQASKVVQHLGNKVVQASRSETARDQELHEERMREAQAAVDFAQEEAERCRKRIGHLERERSRLDEEHAIEVWRMQKEMDGERNKFAMEMIRLQGLVDLQSQRDRSLPSQHQGQADGDDEQLMRLRRRVAVLEADLKQADRMLSHDRPARHKVIFTSQDHEEDQKTSSLDGPYGSGEWGKPVSIGGGSAPAGEEYRDGSPWSSPESKRRGPVYGSVM